MASDRRKLKVIGAGLAAVVALTACAPAGFDAADYGNAAEPASNDIAATPGATAAAEPGAEPTAESTAEAAPAGGGEANTAEISDELATTELNARKVAQMGSTVQDENGFVLYRFDDDEDSPAKSNCNGDCAKVWPPALTSNGEPKLTGVDESLVGTVTRADGTKQLTLKGWPLYRYFGDKKPGQWKGQNVGAKWFVIQPNGAKNLTCLPAVSKPVAPPAEEEKDTSGDAGGEADSGSDISY